MLPNDKRAKPSIAIVKQIRKTLPYTISEPYSVGQRNKVLELMAKREEKYERHAVKDRMARRQRAIDIVSGKIQLNQTLTQIEQDEINFTKPVTKKTLKAESIPAPASIVPHKSLFLQIKDWLYNYFCEAFYK